MSFVFTLLLVGALVWVANLLAPLRKRLAAVEARLAELEARQGLRAGDPSPGATSSPVEGSPSTFPATKDAGGSWISTSAVELASPDAATPLEIPSVASTPSLHAEAEPARQQPPAPEFVPASPASSDDGWEAPAPRRSRAQPSSPVETARVEASSNTGRTILATGASSKPDGPSGILPTGLTTWLSRWNPVVLGGAALVILGVIFLLGLAAQSGLFPPAVRLSFATLLAVGLLMAGWKQRLSRPAWALPLQGTASAILFFVLYSASQQHHLIPAGVAFLGSVLVLVGTAVLAVLQSSQRLAVLALGAGFAAPIVFSTGSGSHVGLFSYYVMLDLGVVVMVALRGWRTLLGLAFLSTYGIATTWGVLRFEPEHGASCEVFLWIFYALFSGAALAFALRARDGQGAVVGSLVFALPLATFALQSRILENDPMLLAWTAAGMGLHHLLAGAWVLRQVRSGTRPDLVVMMETLLVLGTLLASVAVPLALSGRWTSLAWALEGAGLVWLSTRQKRLWHLILGGLLMIGACGTHLGSVGVQAIDAAILALALLSVSRSLTSASLPVQLPRLVALLVVLPAWGVAFRTLVMAIDQNTLPGEETTLAIGSLGLAALFSLWARMPRVGWSGGHVAWIPSILVWLPIALFVGGDTDSWVYFAWLGSALAALAFLDLARRDAMPVPVVRSILESALVHGLVWIAIRSARNVSPFVDEWTVAFQVLAAAGLLSVFVSPRWAGSVAWAEVRPESRRLPWLAPWIAVLAGFVVLAPFGASVGGPLPWLPLLNTLDLPSAGVWLLFLGLPTASLPGDPDRARWVLRRILGAWLLVWMLATAARAFHHFAGVPWDLESLWGHRPLQATWSLLLTAQALGMCWWASRRSLRPLWRIGAILLLVVTAKLMLVDLSGSGSVARIVSFLGAGLLMVGIGYLSPIPPAVGETSRPGVPPTPDPRPADGRQDSTGDAS
jgi:uncharacterized membrane protein